LNNSNDYTLYLLSYYLLLKEQESLACLTIGQWQWVTGRYQIGYPIAANASSPDTSSGRLQGRGCGLADDDQVL